jgi:hypothetical protein
LLLGLHGLLAACTGFLNPGLQELKRPFGASGFQKLCNCVKDFVGYLLVFHAKDLLWI